jgi:phosphoribosylaminoimidazole carboxylase (NCAIR synthetase)
MTEPHDMPDAAALVEAVREFLERDVMTATEGRVQFHTRVAVNVLRMVEREITMGPAQQAQHAAGLARLGVEDERALADAIRTGAFDDRIAEVREFVTETVRSKLEVANPKYMAP